MGTPETFLPVLLMVLAAAGIAVLILVANAYVGRQVRTARKLGVFESGMPMLDSTHKRISVKFFVVAMVFILFDVEIAFLYPWTVVFREGGLGLLGEMFLFIGILLLGYAYLWKKGAFDWE